ncbi:hypothetical protein ACJOV8_002575 [Formosa sp. 3Alg 14/1]|uniref:hypothetical protein n=1 Tax=Formosa sp. 3Alg 14/1 TaxID=3382190 RepID=UPI0039BE2F94
MNKTTLYFGIIFLIGICIYFISSLNSKEINSEFNFGAFNIELPSDWKKIEINGIDSYVGGITNGIDSLTFDYSPYSYNFEEENKEKQLFAYDTINGKIVMLTKPKEIGNGTIGVYIKKAFKKNSFLLIGKDVENEETILEIFKSIKFKDSDTLLNSKQIEFSKSE